MDVEWKKKCMKKIYIYLYNLHKKYKSVCYYDMMKYVSNPMYLTSH